MSNSNIFGLMVAEHNNVLDFIKAIEISNCNAINGKSLEIQDYFDLINFGRLYADKHHHGKEELILFREMINHLGLVAVKIIKQGMLVEHDLGRLYLNQLEESLNSYKKTGSLQDKLKVIVNSGAWSDLLKRHIEKENTVVYTFAQRELSKETLSLIEKEFNAFEDKADVKESLLLLKNIKKKYNI